MFDHRSTSRIDWPCAVLVAGLWLVFAAWTLIAIAAAVAGLWPVAIVLTPIAAVTLNYCVGSTWYLLVRPYAGDWRTGMGS